MGSSTEARYELFDHTADMGVRVFAPTLPALIRPAGDGLYTVIGELVAASGRTDGGKPDQLDFDAAGNEPALLLRDYLAELLLEFERRQRIVTAAEVHEFTDRRLCVTAETQPIDETRSVLLREAKAVTYHELAIRRVSDGYELTYIVDI